MYSILIVLLAIIAHHNGIKNLDLDIMVVTAGRGANSEKSPVLEPVQNGMCEPVDFDCQLRSYENI